MVSRCSQQRKLLEPTVLSAKAIIVTLEQFGQWRANNGEAYQRLKEFRLERKKLREAADSQSTTTADQTQPLNTNEQDTNNNESADEEEADEVGEVLLSLRKSAKAEDHPRLEACRVLGAQCQDVRKSASSADCPISGEALLAQEPSNAQQQQQTVTQQLWMTTKAAGTDREVGGGCSAIPHLCPLAE